jgi:hypothetical protein
MTVLPFRPQRRSGEVRARPAEVVNLWVRRCEREREADGNALIWVCTCGSQVFNWYRMHGLRCDWCGKKTVPPR